MHIKIFKLVLSKAALRTSGCLDLMHNIISGANSYDRVESISRQHFELDISHLETPPHKRHPSILHALTHDHKESYKQYTYSTSTGLMPFFNANFLYLLVLPNRFFIIVKSFRYRSLFHPPSTIKIILKPAKCHAANDNCRSQCRGVDDIACNNILIPQMLITFHLISCDKSAQILQSNQVNRPHKTKRTAFNHLATLDRDCASDNLIVVRFVALKSVLILLRHDFIRGSIHNGVDRCVDKCFVLPSPSLDLAPSD